MLGIDDFAIKKGRTYNTGIHDLRGETMLDLLSGRKLDALRAYVEQHPEFLKLNPKAVVMYLAQTYHTWISECFPRAIRIADCFHVHGYVIESVQAVRKSVSVYSFSPGQKDLKKSSPPTQSASRFVTGQRSKSVRAVAVLFSAPPRGVRMERILFSLV